MNSKLFGSHTFIREDFQRAFLLLKGEESMEKIAHYTAVEKLFTFEFGFLFTEENIEIVVIDHYTSQVRTLGFCMNEDDAEFLLETSIQFGFNEKGVIFNPVPGYQLSHPLESVEV
ncbi:hypothetical protein B14911_10732 [Bacillus sp. NRRL B-14911]|nr:hypothetical protein B14911_10732 [Bacillus sp. NRRL B-14911]